MRYNEINRPLTEEDLFEINMSPKNLKQLAAQVEGAKVGMEFEMYVPDMPDPDPTGSGDPDYDMDDPVDATYDGYADDVRNFFGNVESYRSISRAIMAVESDYKDYLDDASNSADLDDEIRDELVDMAKDDISSGDADEIQDWVNAAIDEGPGNSIYDDAAEKVKDKWIEENKKELFEQFLSNNSLDTMRGWHEQHDLDWPFQQENMASREEWDNLGKEFRRAVGRRTNVSMDYHGSTKSLDAYTIEPDGSLNETDSWDDQGIEFVSPPLSIADMLSDLEKVKEWASARGCYTNITTGLHINISLPNYDMDQLDYVKLALLLGDKHVLEKFGRLSNSYTRSALGKIQAKLHSDPELIATAMGKMREHLESAARQIMPDNYVDKYTSINTKSNRIEFRSPGGDWLQSLSDDSGQIINTMLRFVVAMDAAMDPNKYKDEYAKKLYKLLTDSGSNTPDNTIDLFAKYAAGQITMSDLKSRLRRAQQIRKGGPAAPAAPAAPAPATRPRPPTYSNRPPMPSEQEAQQIASENPFGIHIGDVNAGIHGSHEWDLYVGSQLMGRSDRGTAVQALAQFTLFAQSRGITIPAGAVLRPYSDTTSAGQE